jgi:hypothetical protein
MVLYGFFVIIPKYAPLRIEGFNEFARSLDLDIAAVTDVQNSNYFLSRYEAFGESYTEIAFNMIVNPKELAKVVFGGEKPENLTQTLQPLAYTSLFYPALFVIAIPDLLINYSTTAGGIGTSEIINHRISMIIPVLFISSIYSVAYFSDRLGRIKKLSKLKKLNYKGINVIVSAVILCFSIYTTFSYSNPVYLWLTQAVEKRTGIKLAFAKFDTEIIKEDLELGDRFTLSKLDTKDRECAQMIVDIVPDDITISGPDYLGAHLAQRETYAIFPALYNEADYVIVDIFSQKILRILELDLTLVRDVVADVIKNPNYKLKLGCGNLFVFEKVGPHDKSLLLPLQEKFSYDEKSDLEIFQSLTVVEYDLPKEVNRGEVHDLIFTYVKREELSLDGYVLFLTFVHSETGEIYQVANLASYSLNQTRNWKEDRYYIEDIELALPEFLEEGIYRSFIGMSNEIRTRSIYLGDILVK